MNYRLRSIIIWVIFISPIPYLWFGSANQDTLVNSYTSFFAVAIIFSSCILFASSFRFKQSFFPALKPSLSTKTATYIFLLLPLSIQLYIFKIFAQSSSYAFGSIQFRMSSDLANTGLYVFLKLILLSCFSLICRILITYRLSRSIVIPSLLLVVFSMLSEVFVFGQRRMSVSIMILLVFYFSPFINKKYNLFVIVLSVIFGLSFFVFGYTRAFVASSDSTSIQYFLSLDNLSSAFVHLTSSSANNEFGYVGASIKSYFEPLNSGSMITMKQIIISVLSSTCILLPSSLRPCTTMLPSELVAANFPFLPGELYLYFGFVAPIVYCTIYFIFLQNIRSAYTVSIFSSFLILSFLDILRTNLIEFIYSAVIFCVITYILRRTLRSFGLVIF